MRIIILFLASIAAAFGADCDFSFSLDATHRTVQFNNQTRACYNWQVSYFSSGFSAVSVQFESAPNGANSNVPGTWVAFAGTTVSGSNPMTAITQATTTFTGSFPWVRVRLVTLTGTGLIQGRMLGAQLTSATSFPSAFSPPAQFATAFGQFTPLVDANWSWVDQNLATYSVSADGGVMMTIPRGSASDNLSKRCTPLPSAAPWTVTIAYTQSGVAGGTNEQAGLALYQAGNPVTTEFAIGTWSTDAIFNGFSQCTGANESTCSTISGNATSRLPVVTWVQVIDDGALRTWRHSMDGENWQLMGDYLIGSPGGYAGYANITPNQACIYIYNNNGNFSNSVKYFSYEACAGSTGSC